ncbi:hypothetical protein BVX93_00435, partial [bacterium B13(2017)]
DKDQASNQDFANLDNYEKIYKRRVKTENTAFDLRGNIYVSSEEIWGIEQGRTFPQDLEVIPDDSGLFYHIKGSETNNAYFDFKGNARQVESKYYIINYEPSSFSFGGYKQFTHGLTMINNYHPNGRLLQRTTYNFIYDFKPEITVEGVNSIFNYDKTFTSKSLVTNYSWDDLDNVTYQKEENFILLPDADAYLNDENGYILDENGLKQIDENEFLKVGGRIIITEETDYLKRSLRSQIFNYYFIDGVEVFDGVNGQIIQNTYESGDLTGSQTINFTQILKEGFPLLLEDWTLNLEAFEKEIRKCEVVSNTYSDPGIEQATDIVSETWEFMGEGEDAFIFDVDGNWQIDLTKFEKRRGREIHQENFTAYGDPQMIKTLNYFYDNGEKEYVDGSFVEKIYDAHRNALV